MIDIVKMNGGKKFDICLMNPPYDRDLHLGFLEKSIQISNKIVVVEPAIWLINIKKNGKAKRYNQIKDSIDGHVKSVEINGMNKIFNTGLYAPFSITAIDMSKEFDSIEFECSTEKKEVKSIYDCNEVGEYRLVDSILSKCLKFGDMMSNHVTEETLPNKDYKYVRFMRIITSHGYDSEADKIKTNLGTFYGTFITPALHKHDNKLYDEVPHTKVGNPSPCVYGTAQQLDNWKYYILNNKLPLFINMCLTIDQHNNSTKYIPWIVDKKYTDEEIYRILGISLEEQKLIDDTIVKFEWHSPWYKKLKEDNERENRGNN